MAYANLTSSISSLLHENDTPEVPIIDDGEPLVDVVRKLTNYFIQSIPDASYTFEEMRSAPITPYLRPLIASLAENSHHTMIISALMIAKWEFGNVVDGDVGVNETRGYACEYVAWQFLCHLTKRESIDFLLQELPVPKRNSVTLSEAERGSSAFPSPGFFGDQIVDERGPLLWSSSSSLYRLLGGRGSGNGYTQETQVKDEDTGANNHLSFFFGLNALEIATIAHAKKFLAQRVVQRVIDDIWNGEIIFWDSLSVYSRKKPRFFNRKTADPYSRLRVPAYRKAFEAAFFVSFLILYYAVLVERKPTGVGVFETLMYIWIAAFAYDEVSGMNDAGIVFYQMDFWSLWNMAIIGTGVAFVVARTVGLVEQSESITDLSFDILSLEALFLVPRICSLVSLNSYFGSLIPVLKEMTKAFFRFMPVVIVLYIGFLTTFTMLARDRLSLSQMSWILVKVFFGSSTLGFDIAREISPIFGYGLMLAFVSMTNMLLISSLVSLMSMSLEGVMSHAREEYLFQLSIYVLESSNSRKLTYFLPPLNLIPLLCIRPMRLFLSAESVRRVRIVLLRATHLPFVTLIWAYESSRCRGSRRSSASPLMTIQSNSRSSSSSSGLGMRYYQATAEGPSQGRTRLTNAGQTSDSRGSGFEHGRPEMIDEVERLRAQVERLAAAMAIHRRRA